MRTIAIAGGCSQPLQIGCHATLEKETTMLSARAWVPTLCHLCNRLGTHRTPNLCDACEKQLPNLKNGCPRCALPLPENTASAVCGHCLKHRPGYDLSHCAFKYEGAISRLIIQAKHSRELTSLATLAALFVQSYNQNSAKEALRSTPVHAIVPIPLTKPRHIFRGFNQSRELAKLVSKDLGIPLHEGLLKRVGRSKPQQELNRKQRLQNLQGCFQACGQVAGLNLILFDDVMTTGATMESASLALKQAGANSVSAWSIARTI